MPDGRKVRGTQVKGKEKLLVLLYADDLVLMCENGETLNEIMMRIEKCTQEWVGRLTINVKKTKRMTNITNVTQDDVNIEIRGEIVEPVNEFIYLGSLIKDTGSIEKEIERRLRLGQYRFNELKKPIFDQADINISTKTNIYKAIVLPTILYGAETWTCNDKDYARLNAVNNKMLRYLVGRRRDDISNEQLYKMTNTDPIDITIKRYRLRWTGHIRRMPDCRIPKKVMFGRLVGGKRQKGRPTKSWNDCLENDLELVGLNAINWLKAAEQRSSWSNLISSLTFRKRKK